MLYKYGLTMAYILSAIYATLIVSMSINQYEAIA